MHLVLLTKSTAIAAIAAAATIIAAAAAAAAAVPAAVPAAAAADCAIDRLELDTYLMREALKPQLACNEGGMHVLDECTGNLLSRLDGTHVPVLIAC